MARDARDALDHLRGLAASDALDGFCDRAGIRLLIVFGSAARPQGPVPPRDLDVAVVLRPDADIVAVVTAFVRLLGFDHVDVLDLDRAGLVARAAALGEGEPLYEDEPGLFARRQMATLPLLAETAWIRRLQLEQLGS